MPAPEQLRSRIRIRTDFSHWFVTVFLIAGSIYASKVLDERATWLSFRYYLFQRLQASSPRKAAPRWTTFVLIGDEEYWRGEPARRSPIKRTYLAKLVRRVAQFHPSVVALDFDLRSPVPDGTLLDHPDYQQEDDELIRTIQEVSTHQVIVLPRTLGWGITGLVAESAIYDKDKFNRNVRFGYIEFANDMRQVPPSLRLGNGSTMSSFSLSIAQAINKNSQVAERAIPYGTFIERAGFKDYELTASDILTKPDEYLESALSGRRAVLIGADWHRFSYGRGETVDSFDTPAGTMSGVFIHANYTEAILDSRTFPPLDKRNAMLLEALLSGIIALLFSVKMRGVFKLFGFFTVFAGIVLSAYFFWQNLGLFFDFFIPLFMLAGHTLYEQVHAWKEVANKCIKEHQAEPAS